MVDLAAIRHNVRTLAALVAPAALMTVVKADGYGHGIVESGRAARAGGADLARRRHRPRGAGAARRRRHRPAAVLAHPARRREDGSLAARSRPTSTSRRTPSSALDQIVAAGAGRTARACSSRSTPGSPAVVRPSTTGRTLVAARAPSTSAPAGLGHRRLVALRVQRRAGPPRQRPRRSGASTRRSGSPTTPACDPRYATSPTPPPRSCAPAAGSTWCASGWRSYGLDPAPDAAPPTPTCGPP